MSSFCSKRHPTRLATLAGALIAAGCSTTPSSDDILARAAELSRRAETVSSRDTMRNGSGERREPADADQGARPLAGTAGATTAPSRPDTIAPRSTAGAPTADGVREPDVRGGSAAITTAANASARPTGNGTMAAGSDSKDVDLLPPDAKPGECYARIYIEPTYRMVSEKLIVREATSRIDTVPARFEKVTERVLVKPADQRFEIVPARFEWVEERVLVTPESTRLVAVPAVTRQVSEKVLVKAGYTTWKKGRGPIQKIDETTGEIMCLVEVPPVYDTVSKTVEVSPEQVREELVPAVYRTVRKQVMVSAAESRPVEIPAEYKSVEVERLAEPAREVRIAIPAQIETVQRREMVTPGRVEWREILCETNMTRERIRAIQQALLDAGFDPGPIDGVIAGRTMSAVNAYQRANNLPVDSQLNMATVRALGVMR
ncbi:MAG: peptidoglycan-binding domain-containing protein [Burkholderiaceae bacterium]